MIDRKTKYDIFLVMQGAPSIGGYFPKPANPDFQNGYSGGMSPNYVRDGYVAGNLQSPNYVAGSAGWTIKSNGDVEFNDGTFRGTLNAADGTIGGFTISATELSGGTITGADINGATITGAVITGGTFQTDDSDGADRIEFTDDFINTNKPAIAFYDGSDLVGAIVPMLDVSGDGLKINAYNNADTARARVEVIYVESSTHAEIGLYCRSAADDGIIIYSDNDTDVFVDIEGSRFDCPLNPITGNTSFDLGRSDSMWDDLWIDRVNYNSLSAISDQSLKEEIVDSPLGLADLMKLKPRKFKWKKNGKRAYGFIAQEVQTAIPQLVSEIMQKEVITIKTPVETEEIRDGKKVKVIHMKREKRVEKRKVIPEGGDPNGPGLLQIDMTPMVPMLIKAVQELSTELAELKKKVNDKLK